ncbi:MAG: adenosylcobinamide-GDP ribazoletransferase [Angustibacter sp.]
MTPRGSLPRVRPGWLRDGVRLTFGTLTVVPVPAPSRVDRASAAAAMLLAPVAAVVPGTALAVLGWLGCWWGAPPLLTAAGGLGAAAWLSRGLHLDGLADTADGLASSYDRQRALAVMRSGDVGPAGTTTVVLVLLAQAAATSALLAEHGGAGAVLAGLAVVVSRGVLVITCSVGVPAARLDGLGSAVAGSVPRPAAGLGLVTVMGTAALVAALVLADQPGSSWWIGPLAVLAAGCAAVVLVARCVRRLGGVTGDVLGAAVELAATAALAVLAVLA